jgi:hypothetical protein
MSWQNGWLRMRLLLASSVTAIGLMLVLLTPTLANAAPAHVTKPDASLTASWWQQFVGITDPNTFIGCDVGTGKIVFLTGISATVSTDDRSCTTDKAKTFLVPLINVECSTVEGNGETFAELARCAKDFADDFTDLKLEIDGQPIGNLNKLRVQAESTFTPVPNNVLIPNISRPTNSKFAADGYWALIKLTPGEHTLTFGGTFAGTPPFTTEVTYHLTVKK